MNKKPMPSIAANMKIGNPRVFIFCLYQFIEKESSKKIEGVDDVCAFLETTSKKMTTFEKTGKLPLKWFIKIAETEKGREFLSSFKDDLPVNYLFLKIAEMEKSSSNASSEEGSAEEIDVAADLIEATQHTSNNHDSTDRRSKDMHFPDNSDDKSSASENGTGTQKQPERLDVTKLIGGSNEPRGSFISKDKVDIVLEKLLELTGSESDTSLSRLLHKTSKRFVYLVRKGTSFLYIENIFSVANSEKLLVSKDVFLNLLGLDDYKPPEQQNDNGKSASGTKNPPAQKPSQPDKKTGVSETKSSEEIEQVIRIALLMTGSVSDASIRKEFFLGCLVSRLSNYCVQIKSDGEEVVIKKEGFDFCLSLDTIPFGFKVE